MPHFQTESTWLLKNSLNSGKTLQKTGSAKKKKKQSGLWADLATYSPGNGRVCVSLLIKHKIAPKQCSLSGKVASKSCVFPRNKERALAQSPVGKRLSSFKRTDVSRCSCALGNGEILHKDKRGRERRTVCIQKEKPVCMYSFRIKKKKKDSGKPRSRA